MKEIKKEDIKNLHYIHTNEVQFEYGGRTYHYSMEGLKDLLVTCWNCYSQLEQKDEQLKDIKEYVESSSLEVNTKDYGMITVCNSDDILNIIERNSSDESSD